jgi:DNA-directed RNA polymerase alpha subunit
MKLVYQNPRNDKERSVPLDEDAMQIDILKKAGWHVIERLEEGEQPSLPVVEVDQRKGLKRLDENLQALLADAGMDTDAAVFEATDDEICAVEGIGTASLKKIRNEMAKAY